jgi:hypothetical protein
VWCVGGCVPCAVCCVVCAVCCVLCSVCRVLLCWWHIVPCVHSPWVREGAPWCQVLKLPRHTGRVKVSHTYVDCHRNCTRDHGAINANNAATTRTTTRTTTSDSRTPCPSESLPSPHPSTDYGDSCFLPHFCFSVSRELGEGFKQYL